MKGFYDLNIAVKLSFKYTLDHIQWKNRIWHSMFEEAVFRVCSATIL